MFTHSFGKRDEDVHLYLSKMGTLPPLPHTLVITVLQKICVSIIEYHPHYQFIYIQIQQIISVGNKFKIKMFKVQEIEV